MNRVSELLDKNPYARSLLIVLVVVLLVTFRGCQLEKEEERAYSEFLGAIDQRIENVNQSIASLAVTDENLLGCIRQAAMDRANIHPMSTGGIDDVRELQLLYCRNSGVASLDGLGELAGLRFLDLSKNRVRSLEPLRNHGLIKSLYLVDNPLTSLGPIKTMPSLKEVYLPDMPDMACADIDRMLARVKSNAKAISCAGQRQGEEKQDNKQMSSSSRLQKRDPDELTDAEHEELMNYEREQLYRDR